MTFTTFTEPSTSLPVELIDHILSYLSPRHLIHAALVCQSWATLARRQLNQDIYIHSNRQYTRWLESLETAHIEHRQLVRRIVIHPQVHLDLPDLPILRLCPWVESFDIGTNNKKTPKGGYYGRSQERLNGINDIIGRRSQYPQLLHHWRHLKRLHGYHSDSPTSWATLLYSSLTSLVCSYDDICALSTTLLGDSTTTAAATLHLSYSSQPAWVLTDLVDLHLTFGCSNMPVTNLEMIHTVCPALEHFKLHVQSIHGTPNSRTIDSLAMDEHGGGGGDADCSMAVRPVYHLKSLSLCDMVHFDPGCYSYLLHKYPHLTALHLGFAFDEFYTSSLVGDDGGDLCTNLEKSRSDLFGLISGYRRLTRLEIHLQGANEYVRSLWPREHMEKWMQQNGDNGGNVTDGGTALVSTGRKCGLQHLEMTYQRQSAGDSNDILGLNGIVNSWVGQHQLHTLLLDVYNNDRNKTNNNGVDSLIQTQQQQQHSLQSTLDSFFYSDHCLTLGTTPLIRNMTTLCIKCIPGFDMSLSCLLDGLPGLRILDLAFGNLINRSGNQSASSSPSSSYGLQQLVVGSSNVADTAKFVDLIQHRCSRLTTLCLENVVLDDGDNNDDIETTTTTTAKSGAKSKMDVWDLSDRGLERVWIKYLSFGGSKDMGTAKTSMVNWLKVHEATAKQSTWYDTSMAQGTHGSSKPFRSSDHGLLCAEEEHEYLENGDAGLELKCLFVEDLLFC